MPRRRWWPGGLYWRLSASYFLVTLVAVLTIEAATVLLPLFQEYRQFRSSVPLDQRLETQAAAQIAPYLQATAPDRARLANSVLIPLLYTVAGSADSSSSQAVVLDRSAQEQAAASCSWTPAPAAPVGDCAAGASTGGSGLDSLPVQKSIQLALAGDGRSAMRVGVADNAGWTLVVPVRDPAGRVLGVLVTMLRGSVTARVPITAAGNDLAAAAGLLTTFLNRVQPAGFAFLVLATAIGTLTGVLISRNLTRRLRTITRAADAWSRGDLAVAVPDPAQDEVGQLARDLNRMAAQLQALLVTRQELAVVEERNRLARELHDSVKQQVFAGALLVRAARTLVGRDPATAARHLAEAEALAGQTQQELVALIAALRPAALADKGLAPLLREYVADWARRMGIAAEIRIAGACATPLEVEDALFRVAQESLANVARHSGARAVEVRLAWAAGEICLTVQDDGHGFDPARAAGQGRGLGNMRERVAALGGHLVLAGTPGATCVAACLPLPAPSMNGKGDG